MARRASRRRGAAALLAAALLAAAAPAPCAPPAGGGAKSAEALFEQGKALLEKGKIAAACDSLTRSDELEPSVGTLGLLARCHEKQGRVATAWREYRETARRAEVAKDERGAFALELATRLEPRVPRLTVSVRERVVGMSVLIDRAPLGEDDVGAERMVDPGEIELLASAPGRKSWATTVTLAEGERRAVEVPPLERVSPAGQDQRGAPSRGARLVLAAVAGGVGLAGLGVMTGSGLSASSKNSESSDLERTCRTAADCARGRDLRDEARTSATIADIGLGVGAAGLAAGALLYLTAPSEAAPAPAGSARLRVTPAIGASGGGVILGARF
ncbi:MAG: hypothetical protein IT372_01675 [Polyangiaceae bacterium]|nr:hypothetical protein [Polyangiaceae bacterium]